jgi:hypothetical protein
MELINNPAQDHDVQGFAVCILSEALFYAAHNCGIQGEMNGDRIALLYGALLKKLGFTSHNIVLEAIYYPNGQFYSIPFIKLVSDSVTFEQQYVITSFEIGIGATLQSSSKKITAEEQQFLETHLTNFLEALTNQISKLKEQRSIDYYDAAGAMAQMETYKKEKTQQSKDIFASCLNYSCHLRRELVSANLAKFATKKQYRQACEQNRTLLQHQQLYNKYFLLNKLISISDNDPESHIAVFKREFMRLDADPVLTAHRSKFPFWGKSAGQIFVETIRQTLAGLPEPSPAPTDSLAL